MNIADLTKGFDMSQIMSNQLKGNFVPYSLSDSEYLFEGYFNLQFAVSFYRLHVSKFCVFIDVYDHLYYVRFEDLEKSNYSFLLDL